MLFRAVVVDKTITIDYVIDQSYGAGLRQEPPSRFNRATKRDRCESHNRPLELRCRVERCRTADLPEDMAGVGFIDQRDLTVHCRR